MKELPTITVVPTLYIPPIEGGFGRLQVAKQTIMSWGEHMKYAGDLRLHVCDDTVQGWEDTEQVLEYCRWADPTIQHTRGRGLGGALNAGLRVAFEKSPLVIYADDSYSLVGDVDLTPWAALLMREEGIGAVSLMPPRPGQAGGECLYFHGIRTEGIAAVKFTRDGATWNGRPFMYHRRFFEFYGATPEDCSGYEWEIGYGLRFVEMAEGPEVVFAFHDPFQHVWTVRLGDKPPGWDGR